VARLPQAVIVRPVSETVTCSTAKPGKKNGSVDKKKHLVDDFIE
jgi:hypothetical protein